MRDFSKQLSGFIEMLPVKIKNISEADLSEQLYVGKWSKKEIMGHLCDSAINNLQRFVRIQYEGKPFKITPYDQVNWVMIQNYQKMDSGEIVELWVCLNKQILRIIEDLSEEKVSYPCQVGEQVMNFGWLVEDYLKHLTHHLKQICDI